MGNLHGQHNSAAHAAYMKMEPRSTKHSDMVMRGVSIETNEDTPTVKSVITN
jgi:hypothetical protein